MNAIAPPSGPSPMHRQPHPSPQRERVGRFAIWFAIAAAPLAWNLQLLFNVGLSSYGCFPHDEPRARPLWAHLPSAVGAIEVAAFVVCVVAALVAWRNWHRTRTERPGSAHRVLEAGDGRTRFMALVGLLTSGLFGLAVILAAIVLALVPPCNG